MDELVTIPVWVYYAGIFLSTPTVLLFQRANDVVSLDCELVLGTTFAS